MEEDSSRLVASLSGQSVLTLSVSHCRILDDDFRERIHQIGPVSPHAQNYTCMLKSILSLPSDCIVFSELKAEFLIIILPALPSLTLIMLNPLPRPVLRILVILLRVRFSTIPVTLAPLSCT